MNRLLCGTLVGWLLSTPVTGAPATESSAKISQLVGKAEVRMKSMATWRPGKIGMPVREGSDIRCFVESETEVTFDNGSRVTVGENSVVTLSRLQDGGAAAPSKSTVNVMSGKVWANVKKLTEKQSEFEFETPTAVASIRGTRLGIDVGKKNTLIDVYEGLVVVRRKGSNASVKVTPNTRAIIDPGTSTITVVDFKKIAADGKAGGGDPPPFDPYAAQTQRQGTVEPSTDSSTTANPGQPQQEPAPRDTQPSDTAPVPGIPRGSSSQPGSDQNGEMASKTAQRLTLTIISPPEGTRITEPLILVSGTTHPDAKAFVNDVQATVGRDGAFSARIPIPDEPSAYSVEVRAELGGAEMARQRNVIYEPRTEKLVLECASPVNGQVVTGKTVRISGKTVPRATVTANGVPVSVAANGVFNSELPVTEQNIGDFQIEVVARGGDDELSKSLAVEISGKSPQINTSVPLLVFSMQGQSATTQRSLPVQMLDRTPDEELTLKIINNGSSENIATEPGRTEQLILNEGKNDYQISVVDRAGNSSPVVKGTMYYLPGPVVILLREPSSNPMVYEGLPPALHPGSKYAEEPVDVEVEIDDGIGNVPQSIRYGKVTGNGQTALLRNNNDYIYRGKVNVRRGSNQFVVQVEDLTGRLETLRFEVIVR